MRICAGIVSCCFVVKIALFYTFYCNIQPRGRYYFNGYLDRLFFSFPGAGPRFRLARARQGQPNDHKRVNVWRKL
jgi:hypothetical protein